MISWMIFSPESIDVFYFWNGEDVSLVHVAPHEGTNKNWYWPNNLNKDPLPDSEVKVLKEVAESKRKQVFQIPKGGRRYTVRSRGVFEHTNDLSNA